MGSQTGVDYPTIELGGIPYTVKFTRATMYDLEKAAIAFAPVFNNNTKTWTVTLLNLVDTLKVCTAFPGTAQELTELVFDQRDEATTILVEAWGKVVLPSLQRRTAAVKARLAAKLDETAGASSQPV